MAEQDNSVDNKKVLVVGECCRTAPGAQVLTSDWTQVQATLEGEASAIPRIYCSSATCDLGECALELRLARRRAGTSSPTPTPPADRQLTCSPSQLPGRPPRRRGQRCIHLLSL